MRLKLLAWAQVKVYLGNLYQLKQFYGFRKAWKK
jgi:hypothetical protein